MRDRDRFWWLMLIIGLACGVCGVIVPYYFVRTMPTNDPYMSSADYWQLIGLMALVSLVCLGGGLLIVAMGLRARRQHRRRLAVLRGDDSALLLAAINPDPALAPNVSETPLELMWRSGPASRVINVVMFALQTFILLLSFGTSMFTLVAPLFMAPQPTPEELLSQTPPQPMSLAEIILRVAGACALVAMVVVFAVVIVRIMPHLFGRPFGVSATDSGIDAYTEFGSRIHMDWAEMRLLEVEIGGSQLKRRFAVFAPRKRIAWTEYGTGLGAEYVPVGATASQMALRQAALLGLIAARTGLAPRTLAKALESKPAPVRDVKRSSQAVAILIGALFVAGIGVADYLFPLTPFTWVNWASAGSLALVTLSLLVVGIWITLTGSALPAHASPPSVGAPSFDAPGVAYSFNWRVPPQRRLAFFLGGLCTAVNLFPGAWALLGFFVSMLPGSHPQLVSEGTFTMLGSFMLAFALVGFGLSGLALVYGAVAVATARVWADRNGLTTGNGRRERLVAWSSVRDISWVPGRGGQFAYLVTTDMPTVQISWPAGPQAADAIPPSSGSVPIGADELAALVAARIGKPIRVRGI